MKKLYCNFKFSLTSAFVYALLIAASSCVNTEYDFDKELELEMNLGGTITIPLGYTAPILLSDMLDTDEIEQLEQNEEDGSYSIKMDDSIEIDLSSLTEIDEISISMDNSKPELISTTIEIPSFPAFGLEVEAQSIDVSTDLEQVTTGEPVELAQEIKITPSVSGIPTIGGVTVPATTIDLDFGDSSKDIAINIGDEFYCPDEVIGFEAIYFGSENGEATTASVVFDLSALADLFTEESFTVNLEYLEVKFPEGFVINGGNNIYYSQNLVNQGDKIIVEFTVDKFLFSSEGTLEDLNGFVTTDIADKITVSGVTSGATSSSDQLILNVDSTIEVSDMEFYVEQVSSEIELGEDESLGEAFDIPLGKLISDVNSVDLLDGENIINIDITSIETVLPASGDPIQIKFPAEKFFITQVVDRVELKGDYYVVEIPISDIVNGDGYNQDIIIEQIFFDNEITVDDNDTENNYLEFDPAIEMEGTTLYLGTVEGSLLSLKDFNEFAAKDQAVEITVSDNELQIEDADIIISAYEIEMDDMSTSISESFELPKELERIDYMTFDDKVYITIDINVDTDLSAFDSDLSFNNYTIEFPKFLVFADGVHDPSNGVNFDDNTLTLSATFTENNDGTRSYYLQLEVTEINFTAEEYKDIISDDSTFSLSESIELSGGLKLDTGSVEFDDLEDELNIVGEVNYTLDEIVIAKVYGLFNPEFEAEELEPISLSSLSDAFEGDLSVVLSDPSISFTATNSLDIPVKISSFKLTPTKGGKEITITDSNGGSITTVAELSEPIEIDAATDGVAAVTTIHITPNASSSSSSGEKYIQMENLQYLLAGMPDQVEIEYEAEVDQSQTHMIDLTRETPYYFNIDYSLDVPLTFDELTLDYTTTIENLGGELSDVFDMISTLALTLEVDSTLPISLEIASITPLDASGKEITGLEPFLVGGSAVIAANDTSIIEVEIADNAQGDLSKLDALEIHIMAAVESTEGGTALKADQQISIKMTATIPDGVTVDLNDM